MSESISQNAVEFDVKVSNHDALTKLTSEMNKLKGIDTGIDDPFKNIKQSAQKATSDVNKMTSGVKNNSNALNDGANKASSFTAKLKEIKKISFEKLKSGAGAFAAKLKEAANVSFEKLKSSLKSVQGLLGSGFKKAAGLVVKGIAAAAAGVGALAAQSVNAYADTEQLIGGVETLFGAGGAKSVEEYAQNVGKSVSEVQKKYNQLSNSEATVLNNAKDSFKTTGLSANDYMETVTSFSASLVSSLKGNTEKAATLSNQALVDMSDNANKMGTDMASIQNAYQGFAKQNYTMLDNLKLGYGGTQEEMKRLLKDASALKKAQGQNVKYSINKFSDIIEAIHTVQENMGITGTTMKEAESTISGSLNMLEASWKDTLSSLVSGDGDFDRCIDNLIYSAGKFGENVIPAIEKALGGVGKLIEKSTPVIAREFPVLAQNLLPPLIKAAASIVTGLIKALPTLLDVLVKEMPGVLKMLGDAIADTFGDAFPILKTFGDFIAQNSAKIGQIIPVIVGLAVAIKGFNTIKSAGVGLLAFTKPLKILKDKLSGGTPEKLKEIADGTQSAGNAASGASVGLLESAKAFVLMGAGILLICAGFMLLTQASIALASAGPLAIGVMAGMVAAVALLGFGMMTLLKSLSTVSASVIPGALAMLVLGGALVLVGAGFMLLTQSAIALANAGPLAIGVMAGMVAVIALLAIGAAALAPALTLGAVGFIAFGAAILLVGAGALLAATGLTLVASVLPIVSEYGLSGALAIAALGAGLMVFASGAALAGTGSMVLGAGLLVAAAGVAAFAASALIAVASVTVLTGIMGVLTALIVVFTVSALALSAAFLILGTATPKFADAVGSLPGAFGAMLVPAAALLAVIAPLTVEFAALALALGVVSPAMSGMASSITIMSVMLPMLLSGMSDAPKIFESMLSPTEQLLAVASPLAAAFTVLASAAATLGSAITTTANGIITVLSAMQLLPTIIAAVFSSIENVVKTSCGKLVTISRNCTNNIKSVFSSMNLSSAGQNAMQGLINGMEAKRPAVVSKARNIANSVSRTINDALQIHSPSRVTTESGEFTTLGLINGMENKLPALNAASKKVATTAAIWINDELMAYSSDDGGSSINTIYGGDTTVAPVFNLTINGVTSDSERQTARKVRGWVQDEFENILNSMNRRNARTQYI